MQVAPSGGQIGNQCKWRHLVAKFGTYANGTTRSQIFNLWINLHKCTNGCIIMVKYCLTFLLAKMGKRSCRPCPSCSWGVRALQTFPHCSALSQRHVHKIFICYCWARQKWRNLFIFHKGVTDSEMFSLRVLLIWVYRLNCNFLMVLRLDQISYSKYLFSMF